MEGIERSIILWVTTRQLNTLDVENPPESLSELADGVFLYALFAQMYCSFRSFAHFGASLNTSLARENWAIRLANLTELYQSLTRYLAALNVQNQKSWDISLAQIAREGNGTELLKLMQMTVLAIINCPAKHKFDNRIAEFSQADRVNMTLFIDNLLSDPTPLSEGNSHQLTVNTGGSVENRNELILLQQIQTTHLEQERLNLCVTELKHDKRQLEMTVAALKQDLETKGPSPTLTQWQLENQINTLKREHENEVNSIKDEFAVVVSKLQQMKQLEISLQLHKKRAGKVEILQRQLEGLETNNDQLTMQLSKQAIEIGENNGLKQALKRLKENLQEETGKARDLQFTLESTQQELEQLRKACSEAKNRLRISVSDTESCGVILGKGLSATNEGSLENTLANLQLENSIILEKATENKEMLNMLFEESLTKDLISQLNIANSQNIINELARQLEENGIKTDASYQDTEELRPLQQHIEQLKLTNAHLAEELIQLHSERQILYRNLQDATSETALLHSKTTEQLTIQDLELQDTLISGEIREQLQQKDELIHNLRYSQSNSIRMLEKQYSTRFSKQQIDHDINVKTLITQAEQAIIEIKSDKDKYIRRLQQEKRKTTHQLTGVLASQSNNEYSAMRAADLEKILAERDIEVNCLLSVNKELKGLWKEAAKMLQVVWKELGLETRRIKSAMRKEGI